MFLRQISYSQPTNTHQTTGLFHRNLGEFWGLFPRIFLFSSKIFNDSLFGRADIDSIDLKRMNCALNPAAISPCNPQ